MKLPNGDRAVVDIEGKLRGYALNLEHPRGGDKARVFRAALGWTADDAEMLGKLLLEKAKEAEAQMDGHNGYGQMYALDFTAPGLEGKVTIRSNWIVRDGEDFPRLATCLVKDGGRRK